MELLHIDVPDLNDSYSSVTLGDTQYQVRFTWSETAKRWSFGLYTTQREPIIVGIKLVPRFPLNVQYIDDRLPAGAFGVFTDLVAVGRHDFLEGRASFSFIPESGVV
jgi:hypothetical protein